MHHNHSRKYAFKRRKSRATCHCLVGRIIRQEKAKLPRVRIQCKTARYSEESGCLEFNTAITYARVGGKPHIRKNYKGEIDYFGVYSPDIGKVYLVPVDDVPYTEAKLRLEATKNNQQKGVRWAQDYEI